MRKEQRLKKRDKKRARTIEDCPHPEKSAFLSRQDALRVALTMKEENPLFSQRKPLAPYLCECDMWHLTSHPHPDTKQRKTRQKGAKRHASNPDNKLRKNRPDWNIAHEDITSLGFTFSE